MAFSIAALTTELQTDPASIGYAASIAAKTDVTTANLINAIGVGASFSIFLPQILSMDVQACLDPTEFASLTTTQLSQLSVLLSGGVVNAGASNVRTIIGAIFPAGGPTRTALAGIVKRQGSRAEVLWGAGMNVSPSQVAVALGRGKV